jgi:serine/threonine-protein kinase
LPAPPEAPQPVAAAGYEVLEPLGRGGMGLVYKARHTALKRLVALKVLAADPRAAPDLAARFRGEAEAAARLQHPSIVQVYEVGGEEARPWFTMEYLGGGTLADRLRAAPLEPRLAADLVATLARAAHFAHAHGVVHRDLKPANILLEEPGDGGHPGAALPPGALRPKISDFGLAKQLDGDVGPTRTGVVLGTPAYMAPEQAAGRPGQVGPRTDVHALGAILYESLTGRPPFSGASALDVLDQVRNQDPVPPRRLQPRLPADLETVCLKCLEKDPHRRYATAAALADDLGRWLAGEPVRARPVPAWERLGKWARRRPAAAAFAACAAAALVAAVAGVAWHSARLRAEVERAEAGEAGALRQQRRADANYEAARAAFRRMLARLDAPGLADVARLKEVREQVLEDALPFYQAIIRHEDSPDHGVRLDAALAHYETASIQHTLRRLGPAEQNLRRAVALLEGLARASPGDLTYRAHLARCRIGLGSVLGEGKVAPPPEMRPLHEQARADAEELTRLRPDVAEYKALLAQAHHYLGKYYQGPWRAGAHGPAVPHLLRALALRQELAAAHPREAAYRVELARVHESLGLTYYQTRRPAEAEASFRRAHEVLEALVRERPGDLGFAVALASTCINWGNAVCDCAGKPRAAVALYDRAIALTEAVLRQEPHYGSARRGLLNAHGGRGYARATLGRYPEAVRDFERVVELEDGPRRAFRQSELAVLRARAGDHARAAVEAKALAESGKPAAEILYNSACACSLAAAAVRKGRLPESHRQLLADEYASQAMTYLARLRDRGFFLDPQGAGYLRTDKDLDPLRDRADFRRLLHGAQGKARSRRPVSPSGPSGPAPAGSKGAGSGP